MRVSLSLTMFDYPHLRGQVAAIGRAADAAGFYALETMDHLFQIGVFGPPDGNMLEAYTTLGYLAAVTERVRLGVLITAATYRDPGMLAKILSTLDVLSGGRVFLGIGAGWNAREANGLGLTFPPLKERFEQLEEAVQIILQMWDDQNNGPYDGKHYHLAETLNRPQPLQKPRPPLMIGGNGEKKTLRMVAQYADACNLHIAPVETIRRRLDILKGHCERLGRDYDRIERSLTAGTFFPDQLPRPDDVLAFCEEMAGVGIQHIYFHMPAMETLKPIEMFGEKIISQVAGL